MTVSISPQIEQIIKDALRSGEYATPEEVLSEAMSIWQANRRTTEPTEGERQAAIERLKAFGKDHQLSLDGMTLKQLRDEARP